MSVQVRNRLVQRHLRFALLLFYKTSFIGKTFRIIAQRSRLVAFVIYRLFAKKFLTLCVKGRKFFPSFFDLAICIIESRLRLFKTFLKLALVRAIRIQVFLNFIFSLLSLFPVEIFLFQFSKQRIHFFHADIREPRFKRFLDSLRKHLQLFLRLFNRFGSNVQFAIKFCMVNSSIVDLVLQCIRAFFFLQICCFQGLQVLQNRTGRIKCRRKFPRF